MPEPASALTSWLEHVVRLYLTSIKQKKTKLRAAYTMGLDVLKSKTEKEKEVGNQSQ